MHTCIYNYRYFSVFFKLDAILKTYWTTKTFICRENALFNPYDDMIFKMYLRAKVTKYELFQIQMIQFLCTEGCACSHSQLLACISFFLYQFLSTSLSLPFQLGKSFSQCCVGASYSTFVVCISEDMCRFVDDISSCIKISMSHNFSQHASALL